jgi:hypothetical protein
MSARLMQPGETLVPNDQFVVVVHGKPVAVADAALHAVSDSIFFFMGASPQTMPAGERAAGFLVGPLPTSAAEVVSILQRTAAWPSISIIVYDGGPLRDALVAGFELPRAAIEVQRQVGDAAISVASSAAQTATTLAAAAPAAAGGFAQLAGILPAVLLFFLGIMVFQGKVKI